MEAPTQLEPIEIAKETFALPGYLPIAGLGVLPMTSFLIRGEEPMLIDSGPPMLASAWMQQLSRLIDPVDLRYVFLTHTDPDHLGGVPDLIAAAPGAQLVTTFLGAGKLSMLAPIPPERLLLVEPGATLSLADRTIQVIQPPVFDAPETVAPFDSVTRSLFSADAFGGILEAPVRNADAIPRATLLEGITTWSEIDVPWLSMVDGERMRGRLSEIASLAPKGVFSAHLPPAFDLLPVLSDWLLDRCGSTRTAAAGRRAPARESIAG